MNPHNVNMLHTQGLLHHNHIECQLVFSTLPSHTLEQQKRKNSVFLAFIFIINDAKC